MLTFSVAVPASKPHPVPLKALLGLDALTGHLMRKSFFFSSPLASQRLSLLKHMIGRPGKVAVIIGERGSGKSTLLQQLIAATGQTWRRAYLRRKGWCQEIDPGRIPVRPILRIAAGSRPPTVVIDDAHRLSRPELKWLLKSVADPRSRARIGTLLLFAQPPFREHLDAVSRCMPPGSVVDKIYMTPFTEKQTDEYLRLRFKIAGFLPRHPFSQTQVRAIFKVSGGLPGWINGEAFMLLKRLNAVKGPFRKFRLAWLGLWDDWRRLLSGHRAWARV